MSVIRLSESVINQIAAGEVVERPASVVKELMENAIDAGATRIEIVTAGGGKNLIRITDNGCGMSRDDLQLAVQRHCTSKLTSDLLDIRTLGFRGEALPSVGAVSDLSITSREQASDEAWSIEVKGGQIAGPFPGVVKQGTQIDVANLFHSVPARLKFLKSDRAETGAITEIFKRMALAFPQIRFTISGSDRSTLEYGATDLAGRIQQVLGKEFSENALEIEAERDGVLLNGYVGLPTFNRGNAQHQFFFVNGRPVRDKTLLGAIRGAYSDFLARDRHGVAVLFLSLDPHHVDVNVHPAKADVRFRDAGLIRGLIIGALKQAFSQAGHLSSSLGGTNMMSAFKPGNNPRYQSDGRQNHDWRASAFRPDGQPATDQQGSNAGFHEGVAAPFVFDEQGNSPQGRVEATNTSDTGFDGFPLGAARAQLHKNYIVSQTQNGLVIVDQHAAHERIVYETLKEQLQSVVEGQMLLIPEVIELAEEDVDRLLAHQSELKQVALDVERFGTGAVVVRETPAMLGEVNVHEFIHSLADEIAEWGASDTVMDRLEHVAATMACYGSVRSGRILRSEEMNALLRQMESTPNSGQCNHGRPTYIELELKDIERLFGRTT